MSDDEDVRCLGVAAELFTEERLERLSVDAPALTVPSRDEALPEPTLATLSLVVLDGVPSLKDVLRPESRLALRTEELLPSERTDELRLEDDTPEREPDDETAEREPEER